MDEGQVGRQARGFKKKKKTNHRARVLLPTPNPASTQRSSPNMTGPGYGRLAGVPYLEWGGGVSHLCLTHWGLKKLSLGARTSLERV